MEIKRTLSKVVYRIEPKPEGGFIARGSDPETPTLEAPTREELQQKIQAAISATLAAEFPGLKLPLENKELKYSFHIEAKPGGGFTAHSTDPGQAPIEGATHEEVQHHLAEKLAGALGSYLVPQLSQVLGKPIDSGDVKVFVNKRSGFTSGTGSHKLTGDVEGLTPAGTVLAQGGDKDVVDLNRNVPIVPAGGGNWGLFRFLVAILILAGIAYFFLHRG